MSITFYFTLLSATYSVNSSLMCSEKHMLNWDSCKSPTPHKRKICIRKNLKISPRFNLYLTLKLCSGGLQQSYQEKVTVFALSNKN